MLCGIQGFILFKNDTAVIILEMNTETKVKKLTNRDLLLPYFVPYLAYVAIVSLGQDILSDQIIYILEIFIVPSLLYWAWKWYVPLTGPKNIMGSIFWGIIFGLAGLVIWCLLLVPFIDMAGEPWKFSDHVLRVFAAALIVPVFEELFIRGFVLRAALQWDLNQKNKQVEHPLSQTLDQNNINDVRPGAWSIVAVVVSSIAFSVGHMPYEWLAAFVYSLLISALWIVRKDLLSCIVAHGVTNLTLGIYVYYSGNWGFW